eukprot:760559-Hanusia_phi.AAC.2
MTSRFCPTEILSQVRTGRDKRLRTRREGDREGEDDWRSIFEVTGEKRGRGKVGGGGQGGRGRGLGSEGRVQVARTGRSESGGMDDKFAPFAIPTQCGASRR